MDDVVVSPTRNCGKFMTFLRRPETRYSRDELP